MKNPIQPLAKDDKGVIRFKANAIVRHLLDTHPTMGMNQLAALDFGVDDWRQFAQLIGYSLSGYGDLSYVDDDTYGAAATMFEEGVGEQEARALHMESELAALRAALRPACARLFGVHEDDLKA